MLSLASLLCLSHKQTVDMWYNNALPSARGKFWNFGTAGVHIFEPSTGEVIAIRSNKDICLPATSRGKTSQNCAFRDAVSDGKKYVWATNTQGGPFVEAFAIDTGLWVGSFPTCSSPYLLDYSPAREEMWVHCWGPDEDSGDVGHLDAFSVNAIGFNHEQIQLGPLEGHTHGNVLIDAATPNFAYGLSLKHNTVFKAHVNARPRVSEALPPIDDCVGFYRADLSPVNEHLYLHCYVCCSCSTDKTELGDADMMCGRFTPRKVNVTTGPNPGLNKDGLCGHSCTGSLADTVGVVEFNPGRDSLPPVAPAVVARHAPTVGGGATPHTSPDGGLVALLPEQGGVIELLAAQGNGEASMLVGEVETGFSGDASTADVEFIHDPKHSRNIMIAASTNDNYLVLADLSTVGASASQASGCRGACSLPTFRLALPMPPNNQSSSLHGRGATRSVTWAVGTSYVMVNGNAVQELYIIDLGGRLDQAKVSKVIEGVPSTRIVYAEDYPLELAIEASSAQAKEAMDKATSMIVLAGEATRAADEALEASREAAAGAQDAADEAEAARSTAYEAKATAEQVALDDGDDLGTGEVVGIVVGACAITFVLSVLAAFMMIKSMRQVMPTAKAMSVAQANAEVKEATTVGAA